MVCDGLFSSFFFFFLFLFLPIDSLPRSSEFSFLPVSLPTSTPFLCQISFNHLFFWCLLSAVNLTLSSCRERQLGYAGCLLSESDPHLGFCISSWGQRLGLPMWFLRIWFLARQRKPSAGPHCCMSGGHGAAGWSWDERGKKSKAVHYRCTSAYQHSTSGRFITISLGTCKCT